MESDDNRSGEIKMVELERENQILRLKLSKQDQIIEQMKMEQMEQIDALEEKLNGTIHKSRMMQLTNEEAVRNLVNRQETTLRELLSQNLTISPEEYNSLRNKQNLTLHELVAVKLHQMTGERRVADGHSNEVKTLRTKLREANDVNEESLRDIEKLKKYIIELRSSGEETGLHSKYMALLNEKESLGDRVTEVEQKLQREICVRGMAEKERDDLKKEVGEHRNKIDCLTERCNGAEATVEALKLEKQQLWGNMLQSREDARKSYQEKLERQLTDNKNCLQNDLLRMREEQKSSFERELGHLRNQCAKMEGERDKSSQLYQSTLVRYEKLLSDGHAERRELEENCQDSAARAVFMKSEIERLRLFNEELQRRNKEYEMENERKEDKLLLYMGELESSRKSWEEQISAARKETELLRERIEDCRVAEPGRDACVTCASLRDENKLLRIDLSRLLVDNKELCHLRGVVTQLGDEIPVKYNL